MPVLNNKKEQKEGCMIFWCDGINMCLLFETIIWYV